MQKPTDELGRSYVAFMRVNMDQLRQKLTDELFILTMLEVQLIGRLQPSTLRGTIK